LPRTLAPITDGETAMPTITRELCLSQLEQLDWQISVTRNERRCLNMQRQRDWWALRLQQLTEKVFEVKVSLSGSSSRGAGSAQG